MSRSEQLQIRVTPQDKAELRRRARAAGMGVSAYVLARAIPPAHERLGAIVHALRDDDGHRFALAELADLLAALAPIEFEDALRVVDLGGLDAITGNYIAAMIEHAAHEKAVRPPSWTGDVAPLDEPHFATPLRSLRAHLIRVTPVAFRRRNIFTESGASARV